MKNWKNYTYLFSNKINYVWDTLDSEEKPMILYPNIKTAFYYEIKDLRNWIMETLSRNYFFEKESPKVTMYITDIYNRFNRRVAEYNFNINVNDPEFSKFIIQQISDDLDGLPFKIEGNKVVFDGSEYEMYIFNCKYVEHYGSIEKEDTLSEMMARLNPEEIANSKIKHKELLKESWFLSSIKVLQKRTLKDVLVGRSPYLSSSFMDSHLRGKIDSKFIECFEEESFLKKVKEILRYTMPLIKFKIDRGEDGFLHILSLKGDLKKNRIRCSIRRKAKR